MGAQSASAKAGQFGKQDVFGIGISSPYVGEKVVSGGTAGTPYVDNVVSTYGFKPTGDILAAGYTKDVTRETAAFTKGCKLIANLQTDIDSKTWWKCATSCVARMCIRSAAPCSLSTTCCRRARRTRPPRPTRRSSQRWRRSTSRARRRSRHSRPKRTRTCSRPSRPTSSPSPKRLAPQCIATHCIGLADGGLVGDNGYDQRCPPPLGVCPLVCVRW